MHCCEVQGAMTGFGQDGDCFRTKRILLSLEPSLMANLWV